MQRISSNLTLAFKIFFPTFWFIFMGLLTLFVLFSDPETTPLFASFEYKLLFGLLYVLFGFLIYFFFVRLMRMEVDSDNFYISNYFKTYRYKFEDVQSIEPSKLMFLNILKIKMKSKTSLGSSFRILYKKLYWEEFLSSNTKLKPLISPE